MAKSARPSDDALLEGAAIGVAAGLVLAMAEILVAMLRGWPALVPVRFTASLAMGVSAFTARSGVTLLVASLVHLCLSAGFGATFAFLSPPRPHDGDVERSTELVRGTLFAAAIWFLNFHVATRAVYPWFVRGAWLLQLLLHVAFFGIPLALLKGSLRRRMQYSEEVHEFAHHGAPPHYRES